jgi:GTP-binding protein
MIIQSAAFQISNTDVSLCPAPNKPEYAFIGRSNVGKSSLINMLTGVKKLAKTSQKPGKTRLVNHFIINDAWYLVDLPGYGYAKVGKTLKNDWDKIINEYLTARPNLLCIFVLIDSRLPPQKIDLEFMEWLSDNDLAFVLVFTKTDKQTNNKVNQQTAFYKKELLKTWEELPPIFYTSSENRTGRDEILNYIEETNGIFDAGV